MSETTKGQVARKAITQTIEGNLSKYCPNTIPKMANLIAYDLNLSPDTVRYCYLPMFIDKGILILVNKNGIYSVKEPESFMESVKQKQQKEKVKKVESTSVMANCQQCGKLINTAKQNYLRIEGKIFCDKEHYKLFNKLKEVKQE